jgi:hypothetical protein
VAGTTVTVTSAGTPRLTVDVTSEAILEPCESPLRAWLAIPVSLFCGDGSLASCLKVLWLPVGGGALDGSQFATVRASELRVGGLGADPYLDARRRACCHTDDVARRRLVVWER